MTGLGEPSLAADAFAGMAEDEDEGDEDLQELSDSQNAMPPVPERRTTMKLLLKFLQDVFESQKQFKGELQSACIQFVLECPKELVIEDLASFAALATRALKLGLG